MEGVWHTLFFFNITQFIHNIERGSKYFEFTLVKLATCVQNLTFL